MSLNFYGGVNEIGGNKILVDNKDHSNSSENNISSLFLDFGMSFSKAGDYFSEFLQPRKLNGIMDFIELGLLPKIKGIYREDYLKHCGINSYKEPVVDGVLLSHAHMDHCSHIHHLREDIPIFMRKESEIILQVLEDTGKTSFSEIMNTKKSFHYVPKKRGEGYKKLTGDEAEEDIEFEATNTIKNHEGLIIVNYPIRDLDRLVTFHNIAKNTDRILAINSKQAYILKLLENEKDIETNKYPKLKDPNIAVYFPRKKQGLISGEHYVAYDDDWKIIDSEDDEVKKDYETWEREFLDEDNAINYTNLKEDPKKYIFRCDFFELNQLIDIKPENGLYIHSITETFNEEMGFDFKRVENWLNHFNLPIYKMHVSGHGKGKEILNMIREINPEKIYPIHTEHAKLFDILRDDGITVIHPELKS